MRALLLGGTGAVGKELLDLLLEDSSYESVHVLSRRELAINHTKIVVHLVDLEKLQILPKIDADVLYVAFGTTLKLAGSKERQELIDVEIPLKIMRLAFEQGTKKCALVSVVGVSEKSPFFYSRMKARLDRQAKEIGFDHLIIAKPSMLDSVRSEKRAGEQFSIILGNWLGKTGLINAYRPVKVRAVAAAMIYKVNIGIGGFEEISNKQIPIEAKKYAAL